MNGPDQDIYHSDGTINYEYCRWLIGHAERQGWLKRSRWMSPAEVNAVLNQRKETHAR